MQHCSTDVDAPRTGNRRTPTHSHTVRETSGLSGVEMEIVLKEASIVVAENALPGANGKVSLSDHYGIRVVIAS